MPEIKNTFTGGRMNKDLDERLVPNGEYRHALNIEVKTSVDSGEGEGNIGTVQNIQGNDKVGTFEGGGSSGYGLDGDAGTKCIGSIANERKDKAYFFFTNGNSNLTNGFDNKVYIDAILEQDATTNETKPVIIDKHAIFRNTAQVTDASNLPDGSSSWNTLTVTTGSDYRAGMSVTIYGSTNPPNVNLEIKSVSGNVLTFTTSQETVLTNATAFRFLAPRVLNFSSYSNGIHDITGINIIDDYLLWTDGVSEPKKINIEKCKEGSTDMTTHTKLTVYNPTPLSTTGDDLIIPISDIESTNVDDQIKEEHITVIKKPPTTPPTIQASTTYEASPSITVTTDTQYFKNTFSAISGGIDYMVSEGDTHQLVHLAYFFTKYRANEILRFTSTTDSDKVVKVRFLSYLDAQMEETLSSTVRIKVLVLEIEEAVTESDGSWEVDVIATNEEKPLFELSFQRFGYRYKYDDGEYSTFSPFTNIMFSPGGYKYDAKHGYNLGMVNKVVELTIRDFVVPFTQRPLDVSCIEILVKRTDSNLVYVVKEIRRGVDPEWDNFVTDSLSEIDGETGKLIITADTINHVLPENQIIRSWDNVPRYAKAQEIIGNRLLFANYTQGYNIYYPISVVSTINSQKIVSKNSPKKSIKSLRNYEWGLVFGDKYGRETPVITSSYLLKGPGEDTPITSSSYVSADLSYYSNSFVLKQNWTTDSGTSYEPPDWMEYVKYYVKETSNEYYNLVMDKWYYAEEKENIWLSFPSADRNKIDEETYLILKKTHGNDDAVRLPNRYKIISIDNEAPDYIKTERRTLGRLLMTKSQLMPNTNSFQLNEDSPKYLYEISDDATSGVNTRSLNFTSGQYGNLLKDYERKGTLKFRIVADLKETELANSAVVKTYTNMEWRTINNYKTGTGSNPTCTFKWEDNLTKTEIDYYTIAKQEGYINASNLQFGESTLTAAPNINYYFEIAEDVVDNKPEFDGRFFVLIEKDDDNIIADNVERLSMGNIEYGTIKEFDIAYIESAIKNPATQGVYADHTFNDGDSATYLNGVSFGTASSVGDPGDYTGTDKDPALMGLGCTGGSTISAADGGEVNVINLADDTYSFWNALFDNMKTASQAVSDASDDYGRIFMDGARSRRWQWNDGLGDANEALDYFKPEALDQGGADAGTLGRMVLSQAGLGFAQVGLSGWNSFDGAYSTDDFRAQITNGTLIRFKDDSTQSVYKIVTESEDGTPIPIRESYIISNFSHFNTTTGVISGTNEISLSDFTDMSSTTNPSETAQLSVDCAPCVANMLGGGSVCNRASIRFEFRKVVDGQLTNEGIDPTKFDPRGALRHDGIGTIKLQIVSPLVAPGSIVVPEANRAVWETEPKKSVELDLYYEASPALPLKLTKSNLYSFIPTTGRVSIRRDAWYPDLFLSSFGAGSVLASEDPNLLRVNTASPFSSEIVKDTHVEYAHHNMMGPGTTVVLINSAVGNNPNYPQVDSIGVGDYLVFNLGDNTRTRSKVINKVTSAGVEETKFYRRIKKNFDGNSFQIQKYDTASSSWTGTGATSGLNSGLQILPTNVQIGSSIAGDDLAPIDDYRAVPLGCFIWNYYGDSLNMTTTLGVEWMAVGGTTGKWYYVYLQGSSGYYQIDSDVYKHPVEIGWHNCYSFGNGVESNRIRDDFNAPKIDNGVKVSTTFSGYKEENKTNSMIYSGLYNSGSSVNDLNQFIAGEKITKDINPSYGSIQRLKTRDNDVVVFTEDKVLKVLANKDALYNADGNPQLTATDRVLGTAIPFAGDYGISTNPESLASDQYRMYFTDKQRGAVLRLSRDGLTPISNIGMKTYFKSTLKGSDKLVGSFDIRSGEYNLTLSDETVSFSEATKGWVSFRSFVPERGCSVFGKYYTGYQNCIYEHYTDVPNGTFYGELYPSSIEFIFNSSPETVKSFKTIGYEGSQAQVEEFKSVDVTDEAGNTFNINDNEYYNLTGSDGWNVTSIKTDMDVGVVSEFINKENKWFNKILGTKTNLHNIDTSNFSVQGLGFMIEDPTVIITEGDQALNSGTESSTEDVTNTDNIISNEDGSVSGSNEGSAGSDSASSHTLTIKNDPNS